MDAFKKHVEFARRISDQTDTIDYDAQADVTEEEITEMAETNYADYLLERQEMEDYERADEWFSTSASDDECPW